MNGSNVPKQPTIPPMPSAEPKTGKWINQQYNEEWYGPLYKCNLCGAEMIGEDNFCPNCGARMEVDNGRNNS